MTVAGWLLLAAAAVLLVDIALQVVYAISYHNRIDRIAALTRAAPDEVTGERLGNMVTTLIPGALALLLVIWLAACVPPLLRGRNVARIFALIPVGLTLLCCAGQGAVASIIPLLIFGGLTDPMIGAPPIDPDFPTDPDYPGDPDYRGDPDYPDYAESDFYGQLYSESDPVWDTVTLLSPVLVLIATALAAGAAVLLLLPSANRYFSARRHLPTYWPGYGYPPPVGYPPVGYLPPGYPPGFTPAPPYGGVGSSPAPAFGDPTATTDSGTSEDPPSSDRTERADGPAVDPPPPSAG
ncbi:hypothetical protein BDK92_3457 [Micromonospora pisi]|uniref:Uncharacterized protein n=1 Tax=Micromonospora pisi TaxID=589240 RepID=A0A495JJ76_9ACTN|nr:hypothetical protein BDK92_3457 [Micromonospora pisi]